MRQVPELETPPFGIVGDGRVARHVRHYFSLLGLPVHSWSRRGASGDPVEALASCGTVLLLIADRAIAEFVDEWPGLRKHRLVHCSGSLVTPFAECAHPLMTFGPELYDLPAYQSIPFVVDAGGTPFAELLPGLPNRAFTLAADQRPYYHALCVMAGNFSALLWLELFDRFEQRLGIPAAAAHPFLMQTARNLIADPGRALTGPLVRGDSATVAANLQALEGDPFHDVYSAFARAYARRG
jgi:2-dehydropantoate 2-reductase